MRPTIKLPSGLKQTEFTLSLCPVSVKCSYFSSKFHIFIVLSSDPLAINIPSGLKHTDFTLFECPVSEKNSF